MSGAPSLRYFRLRCSDLRRSVRFYTRVMGMKRDKELRTPGFVSVVVHDGTRLRHRVSIRLEHEESSAVLEEEEESEDAGKEMEPVYQVWYVKNLDKLVARVINQQHDTGAWMYIPPQRHGGVKIAAVVDPGGMLLRLVECPADFMLRESSSSLEEPDMTWQVRLGYFVFPCTEPDERAKLLQSLLSNEVEDVYSFTAFRRTLASTRPVGSMAAAAAAAAAAAKKEEDAAAAGRSAKPRAGLYVVDREDFPEVLTTYVWLGSSKRSLSACLCMFKRVVRRGAAISRFTHDGPATTTAPSAAPPLPPVPPSASPASAGGSADGSMRATPPSPSPRSRARKLTVMTDDDTRSGITGSGDSVGVLALGGAAASDGGGVFGGSPPSGSAFLGIALQVVDTIATLAKLDVTQLVLQGRVTEHSLYGHVANLVDTASGLSIQIYDMRSSQYRRQEELGSPRSRARLSPRVAVDAIGAASRLASRTPARLSPVASSRASSVSRHSRAPSSRGSRRSAAEAESAAAASDAEAEVEAMLKDDAHA
eukprot:PLAT10776.1.p1 GENE.PLAT10776.1~~PLAT10776.1.p1  ORF type:complete len:544 (-),score=171.38 PLAT10776.1:151-1758(-)